MTAVWAHRGASADAPENTLAAFALAVEHGAHGIELDVQLTADAIPVVIHDETVDRTTDGEGRVIDYTLNELRRLRIDQSHRIPTLDEVLALVRMTEVEVNIELKNSIEPYPSMQQRVVQAVRDHGMADRVWYSSFAHETLSVVREHDPDARTGILVQRSTPWAAIAAAQRVGAQAVHPSVAMTRIPGWTKTVRHAGLHLHVWTVDRPFDVRRCAAVGADAVITNRPLDALAALDGSDR